MFTVSCVLYILINNQYSVLRTKTLENWVMGLVVCSHVSYGLIDLHVIPVLHKQHELIPGDEDLKS